MKRFLPCQRMAHYSCHRLSWMIQSRNTLSSEASPFHLHRILLIIVTNSASRDVKGMTSTLGEQIWEEGQARVFPEPANRSKVEMDISYVSGRPESLKSVSKALVLYRYLQNKSLPADYPDS